MKHIRLIALGTAVVLSLSLLAGCGGSESTSGSLSDTDISAVAPEVSMPEASAPDLSEPDASTPDASDADKSEEAPVEEPKAEQTLSLNKSDFTLKAAKASYKLRATVTGVEKAKVIWSTSDEKIVTVAEDGTVTAVAPGTATITAAVEGTDLTVTCVVRASFKVETTPEETPEPNPEEKPQQPAPEEKPEPEAKPEPAPEPKPEAPAVDHTSRYSAALNASKCELFQYNPPFTDGSADAALALEFVGLSPDMVTDFVVSFSMMNVKAYGLAAVMPAAGQQGAVVAGLKSYVARMQQQFERYLPDQYEVAKAAKVVTLSDGTVLLVMCEGQDGVLANIKAALG